MGTIDIYDAIFTGTTRDSSGKIIAKPGDRITCFFRRRNNASSIKYTWWAVHDRYSNKRLASGTAYIGGNSNDAQTKTITMPDHQLNLEYWTGPIVDGSWVSSHNVNFNPIYVASIKGSLAIYSIPSLGSVYIARKYVGLNHWGKLIELDQGFYFVEVKIPGYQDAGKTVNIFAGTRTNLSLDLTPVEGTIAIGSTPTGAKIYIDNTYVGTTGVGLYKYVKKPPGTYTVKLTMDNYMDASESVRVRMGETTTYNPILKAATGKVYVSGKHLTGAEIYVDDVATGVLIPGTVTVSVGKHNIVAKKEV